MLVALFIGLLARREELCSELCTDTRIHMMQPDSFTADKAQSAIRSTVLVNLLLVGDSKETSPTLTCHNQSEKKSKFRINSN